MEIVQCKTQVAPLASTSARASRATAMPGGEFITFRLGDEDYGISTLSVQEIRSYEAPTRIANSPAFFRGVIDLRGVIVPIVDLRIKLGCASADLASTTVVMVLNVHGRVVGVVVDAVTEVMQIPAGEIRSAPELNSSTVDTRFIIGMSTIDDRMLILMDIDPWMRSADMGLLAIH